MKLKNNVILCRSDSLITVNLKLNMHFPINHFSTIVRRPPCTTRCVLSCTEITYFISASVAVDQRFNAVSKKENNTETMPINFLIKCFQKRSSKGLRPATLLKKTLWHRCFPVNFAKFLRTPSFIEQLWWLLLCFLKNDPLPLGS